MALSSPGIGSNLDVNGIVQKLMSVEAQPLTMLARKEASFQAKLSAFGSLSGALGAFQSALAGLSDPAKFQALSATPADTSIITASANSQAAPGIYEVNVTSLARAQTIKSAAQASTTAAIGGGASTTLTFQFGTIGGGTTPVGGVYPDEATFTQDATRGTGTVTIDSTNNSLQGIRDAINKANIGVTATIVSDGSATPHHLVLTSSKTGLTSSMKISVSGDAALQDLLSYNPDLAAEQKMTETSAAKNTVLTVNGITVNSTTKTVSDAIQGVTLNVVKEGSTSLNVARDTNSVTAAVNSLVKSYNDLNGTLKSLTSYNAETKQAGALLGDSTVRAIQAGIRQALSNPLSGAGGSLKTLSGIGIAFQKDGTLSVDSTKLQNAVTNNFADIAGLFAAVGTTTDGLISVTGSSAKTKPGKYDISIDTLARQGSTTGTVDLTLAPTTIDPSTTLNVTLDGKTASVTVPTKTGGYSAAEFAAMLQSAINGTSTFITAGASVMVTIDTGGVLKITSARYGSASAVTLASNTGTSAAALMGAAPANTAGVDVAGSIGGMTATGSGQTLSGAVGSVMDGLKLQVTGGAVPSARGSVSFSRGYADQLKTLIDGYLGSSGLITGRTEGINSSIKDIDRVRQTLNTRLAETEKRYRAQFIALDTAISSMNSTSNFLQQQLSNLPKIE